MDALKRISEALSSDPLIAAKVETRIKYYVYPDSADVSRALCRHRSIEASGPW